MPKGKYDHSARRDHQMRRSLQEVGARIRIQELLDEITTLGRLYPTLQKEFSIVQTVSDAQRPVKPALSEGAREKVSTAMRALWENRANGKTGHVNPKSSEEEDINTRTGRPYKMNKAGRDNMRRAALRRLKTKKGRQQMLKALAKAHKVQSKKISAAEKVRARTIAAHKTAIRKSPRYSPETKRRIAEMARKNALARWQSMRDQGITTRHLAPGVPGIRKQKENKRKATAPRTQVGDAAVAVSVAEDHSTH